MPIVNLREMASHDLTLALHVEITYTRQTQLQNPESKAEPDEGSQAL